MNEQVQVWMPVQDTLRLRLTAERLVKRTSIAVMVEIVALISTQDRDTAALETKVRAALKCFIDAHWHTASSERTRDDSGFDRVKLVGYARVEREATNVRTSLSMVSRAARISSSVRGSSAAKDWRSRTPESTTRWPHQCWWRRPRSCTAT